MNQGCKKYKSTPAYRRFWGRKIEDYSTFAEIITCARVNYKLTGLSMEEAARRIGISTNYLRLLENEERKIPNPIVVHNMQLVFGFNNNELVNVLKKQFEIKNKGGGIYVRRPRRKDSQLA